MVEEVTRGTGSNYRNEVSTVKSTYKLNGAELIDVQNAHCKVTKSGKLTVITEYSESCSFKIVVKEDERLAIHTFSHVREIVPRENNHIPNKVKPRVKSTKSKYPTVDAPSLVELV